jgi:hypothetical protein
MRSIQVTLEICFHSNSETKLPAGLGSRAASGPEVNDVFFGGETGELNGKKCDYIQ